MRRILDRISPIAALAALGVALCSGGPGRAIGDAMKRVEVTNSHSDPVPVMDMMGMLAGVRLRAAGSFGTAKVLGLPLLGMASTPYVVPARHTLVIEYVNARITQKTSSQTNSLSISVSDPTEPGLDYQIPVQRVGQVGGAAGYELSLATVPVRIYARPGAQVRCAFHRDTDTTDGKAEIAINGRLIPLVPLTALPP